MNFFRSLVLVIAASSVRLSAGMLDLPLFLSHKNVGHALSSLFIDQAAITSERKIPFFRFFASLPDSPHPSGESQYTPLGSEPNTADLSSEKDFSGCQLLTKITSVASEEEVKTQILEKQNITPGSLLQPSHDREDFDQILPNPSRTVTSHPIITQSSDRMPQPVTVSLPEETPTTLDLPIPSSVVETYDDSFSDDRTHGYTTITSDEFPEITDSLRHSMSSSLPSASPRAWKSDRLDYDLSSDLSVPVLPITTHSGVAATPEPSRSWQPRQATLTVPDQTPEPVAGTEQESDTDRKDDSSKAEHSEYPPASCFEVQQEPFIESLAKDPERFRDELASRKEQQGIMFEVPEFAPVIASIESGLRAFISVSDAEEGAIYSDFLEQINKIKEQNYPYRQVMVVSWLFSVLSDYHYGRHQDRYNRPKCGYGLPEGLHQVSLAKVYQIFSKEVTEPHRQIIFRTLRDRFQRRLMCFYPPAAQSNLKEQLGEMLWYMECSGIIFYPTFSSLTCEFMNRTIIWGMFPAGLLNVPWLVVDGDRTTAYGFIEHDASFHAGKMASRLKIPLAQFMVHTGSPEYQQQQELVTHTRNIAKYWDGLKEILSKNEYEALQLFFFYKLHEHPISLDAFHTYRLSDCLFFSLKLMRKNFPVGTDRIDPTEFLKYENPHLSDLDLLMAMLAFMPFSCARGQDEKSGQPLSVPEADELIARARRQLQLLQKLWSLPDELLDECIESLIQNSFYSQWFNQLTKDFHGGSSRGELYGLYMAATDPSFTYNNPPAARPCLLWLLFSGPNTFEPFSDFLAHWLEQYNIQLDPKEGSNYEVLKMWRESFLHLNEEI